MLLLTALPLLLLLMRIDEVCDFGWRSGALRQLRCQIAGRLQMTRQLAMMTRCDTAASVL